MSHLNNTMETFSQHSTMGSWEFNLVRAAWRMWNEMNGGRQLILEDLISSFAYASSLIAENFDQRQRHPVRFTYYDLLVQMLNEFDRLTGRKKAKQKVDYSEVCKVMKIREAQTKIFA